MSASTMRRIVRFCTIVDLQYVALFLISYYRTVVHMLHFLKLIKFTLLFYFPFSDPSKMVD